MTHCDRIRLIYAPIVIRYIQPKTWAGVLIREGAADDRYTLQLPQPPQRGFKTAKKPTEDDRDYDDRAKMLERDND